MRYATARYENYRRELAYRIYVTDSVQLLTQGKSLAHRYLDQITPKEKDDRPAIDIAHSILSRAGIEVKQTNG